MSELELADTARLAWDTILRRTTRGIPIWAPHMVDQGHIERLAGLNPGDYRKDPEAAYLAMFKAAGSCMVTWYAPDNAMGIGEQGYEHSGPPVTARPAIVLDDMLIDSPEAVVEHMERFLFPRLRHAIDHYDEEARVREILNLERQLQRQVGPSMIRAGHGFVHFPDLRMVPGVAPGWPPTNEGYGYENYLMACALYPEMMEQDFSLQADLCVLNNRAAARAYREGHLPPLFHLDRDFADAQGTMVDIRFLEQRWLPHIARSLEPVRSADVRLIWHCDGNVSDMIGPLLDAGVSGFQGFQYEHGMDYEKICRMKTRDNEHLIVIAGVSVTTTLPKGTPDDVRRELRWLVEHGPPTDLFLGISHNIMPGVPWENVKALIDGFHHYRTTARPRA